MFSLQCVLFITSSALLILLLTVVVDGQEDSEEIFLDFGTHRGETGPIVWGDLRGRGGWGGWNAWDGWLPRPYLADLHAYHIPGPYGWGWNGAGSDWFEYGDDYWK